MGNKERQRNCHRLQKTDMKTKYSEVSWFAFWNRVKKDRKTGEIQVKSIVNSILPILIYQF